MPGVQRQLVHAHQRRHAGFGQAAGAAAFQAQGQIAAQRTRVGARQVAHPHRRSQRAQLDLQLIARLARRRGQRAGADGEWQRLCGAFAQGRGQVQFQPFQAGADADLGRLAAPAQAGAVAGLPAGLFGQGVQGLQVACGAQAFGADLALGTDQQAWLACGHGARTQAPFDAAGAAQHLGLHALQGKSGLCELHRALGTAHEGHQGADLHVVAGQRHAALDFGVLAVLQRNVQPQLALQLAAGAGLRQRP